MNGDWERWIFFFLTGVTLTAQRAVLLAEQILDLFRRDEMLLQSLGGRRGSALQVMRILQGSPYSSARSIVAATGLALNTVVSTLEQFRAMGLVVEVTGRERGKIYRYREYLRLLDEGTELL